LVNIKSEDGLCGCTVGETISAYTVPAVQS
jgi:hypothetical protein